MALLRIEHISKKFNDKLVLDDVSLEINSGDIYGILGLSGAGKSTLLRCINGLERIDEGYIYLNDELIASKDKTVDRKTKTKMAMIFQNFNLLSQLNALKNVELALELTKDKENIKERSLDALKRVGLLDKANRYPSELSGGEMQRVAIARALVLKPEILLSDEATSSLDNENAQSILNLLKELNKELGLTIIMISHQLETIEAISNKVAIISDAKIKEFGDLSDVFLNPKTDVARDLIFANHVKTMLDEHRMIRLIFDGNLDEPIIANIVEDCSILVSIVYADTKVIKDKMCGQVVIKLPKENKDIEKLDKYLDLHHIKYEELTSL